MRSGIRKESKLKTPSWGIRWGYSLPVCLAWALGTAAQAKNELNCTIVDEAGNPVAKQEMVLASTRDGKEWKKKTNDKGLVEFKGLEDGSYQLRGQAEGYLFAKSAPIELTGNVQKPCQHTLPSVNFYNTLLQDVLNAVKEKKFSVAEEKGKKAVELSPQEAGAHYVLSVSYASQGRESDALAAVKKAAELNPEKFQQFVVPIQLGALDEQAKQANAKGDFAAAIQKYENMLTISPNEANVHYNIALAYGHQGKFDLALKAIDKAIELKPTDAEFQQIKIRLQDQYLKAMDKKLEK